MSSEDSDFIDEDGGGPAPPKKKSGGDGGGKKRMSVERIYQKKSQLEHILIRPDTYIGSVEFVTQSMWVYDGEEEGMVNREITFVPGLYKIFDEILVNAADNKVRDKKMDCIKVTIDPEHNMIKIWNNGQGIPVVEHKDEKMYVPTLIFGHLLTSSNYNDEEQKVTGGRNGYGAKLCNVFSTKFIVETATKQNKKCFKQVWTDNMSKKTEPRIDYHTGDDYTCITFYPDLNRFKMKELDKDIVALMSKRAYDIAGTTKGVRVYLNSKKLPIRGFKEYVEEYLKGKEDETGNPLKCVYEAAGERWEVALSLSIDKGFQQVSFVNSIATFKGGRHVDYINDQIVSKITEQVKKKNKGGVQVKPFQIKSHIWLFVNCQIVNPTFDSQTKENMTLQAKSFGSKCALSDKFIGLVLKSGVVESVLNWVKFKTETQLNKKCSANKINKLKGIPKLEDANDAGTKNSIDCTLILTEGDSAKTLAVSGLGVVGRDKYGVFPLRGKMLNVREATQKQILDNAEINNIIKIMGLQYKKRYETVDDLKKLRYGKLMIMTDQDQDGSHIKGLLINFIHHNWPSLLKLPFLEEFITPIVKAFKGNNELKFYSMPEFEEWKTQTADWNKWRIKYYKGLGTSTAKEAREYFADMVRHRIKFRYKGTEDDNAIQLAFSKKMIEQRKDWLSNGMQERKQRRELGLPEMYVYGKNTTAITYSDFVNKELILFSNTDNERSIPSMVDGLKPGQRKVIFTCIKRKDKKEVKVAQLAGSVAEHSAYHHGEQSLMSTIINLAQNFVGSHNINLLMPIGQFGTRLQGGKDAASPRYIFTKLSPLAKHIISHLDQPLLNHLRDDNQVIEPEYYVPIIPMVLVNGAEGIGTGWSTKIPNYNPREVVDNIRRMLNGDEPRPMKPWYKNFRGTIDCIDSSHFITSGEAAILGPGKIEITELPVKTWTQAYKESVLEAMVHGGEKTPSQITDYKEYTTDTTVRFVVSMPENNLSQFEEKGLHKVFKLQTPITINSMVLFDSNGVLKRYESPEEILQEFYTLRLDFYGRRKAYLEGMLEAEARKLTNQARFILEKIDGTIILEDRKKKTIIDKLIERNYDSDPVKAWKESQIAKLDQDEGQDAIEKSTDSDNESDSDSESGVVGGKDYDYLLQMTLLSLSREMKEKLLRQKGDKLVELEALRKKSPSDLWKDDLELFMEELDKTEAQERLDDKVGMKGSDKMGKGKKAMNVKDTLPSAHGQRVAPFIDAEMRKKVEKNIEVKKKKKTAGIKTENGEDEESDTPLPLAERIGTSPAEIEKKAAGGAKKGLKQSKINFKKDVVKKEPGKKKSPPKKKRNEWSGSDESGSDNNIDISYASDRPISTPPPPRRAAQVNKRYTYSDSDEEDMEDLIPRKSPSPPPKPKPKAKAIPTLDSDEEEEAAPKKNNNVNGAVTEVFPVTVSSDSDSYSGNRKLKGTGNTIPNPPDTNALFDSLLVDKSDEKENTVVIEDSPVKPKAKAAAPKVISDSDDDIVSPSSPPPAKKSVKNAKRARNFSDDGSSEEDFVPKKAAPAPSKKRAAPKKTAAATKPNKKAAKKVESSDDEVVDFDDNDEPSKKPQFDAPPRARQARAKAPIKYSFDDDESSGEEF